MEPAVGAGGEICYLRLKFAAGLLGSKFYCCIGLVIRTEELGCACIVVERLTGAVYIMEKSTYCCCICDCSALFEARFCVRRRVF